MNNMASQATTRVHNAVSNVTSIYGHTLQSTHPFVQVTYTTLLTALCSAHVVLSLYHNVLVVFLSTVLEHAPELLQLACMGCVQYSTTN